MPAMTSNGLAGLKKIAKKIGSGLIIKQFGL